MVFPEKNTTTIITFNKSTKVIDCSLDGNTDFFDIVAGILQGDTLTPLLFIMSLHYELQTSSKKMKVSVGNWE